MALTPVDGVRAMRVSADHPRPNRLTTELPPHLADWQLPPDWRWGGEGVVAEYRHYQEIIDALGRSLSLVTAPDPAHNAWLAAEARYLGHRNHPSIPDDVSLLDEVPGCPARARLPAPLDRGRNRRRPR